MGGPGCCDSKPFGAECAACGVDVESSAHQSLEWGVRVGRAAAGTTQFWQTALAATVYRRSGGSGLNSELDEAVGIAEHANSVAASETGAAFIVGDGFRALREVRIGSSGVGATRKRIDRPLPTPITPGPTSDDNEDELRGGGKTVPTPGPTPEEDVPGEKCCCILENVELTHKAWPWPKSKNEKGEPLEADIRPSNASVVTLTITFSWKKHSTFRPCIVQWWEYTTKSYGTFPARRWVDLSRATGIDRPAPPAWEKWETGDQKKPPPFGEKSGGELRHFHKAMRVGCQKLDVSQTVKDRDYPIMKYIGKGHRERWLVGLVRVFSGCPSSTGAKRSEHAWTQHAKQGQAKVGTTPQEVKGKPAPANPLKDQTGDRRRYPTAGPGTTADADQQKQRVGWTNRPKSRGR